MQTTNGRFGAASALAIAIAAAWALGTGVATAQGLGAGGMGPSAGGTLIMQRFDANNDGKITQQEFSAGHDDWFKTLDTDGDGVISRGEFTRAVPARNPNRAAQMFTGYDANGNGSIDAAEFRQARTARFQRLDRNSDGVLTSDETVLRRGGGRGPGFGPSGWPRGAMGRGAGPREL